MLTLVTNVVVHVSDDAETMVPDGALLIQGDHIAEIAASNVLNGRHCARADRVVDTHTAWWPCLASSTATPTPPRRPS